MMHLPISPRRVFPKVHEPLQVPTIYLDRLAPLITDNSNRLFYHAMVAALDDVVGNVTAALQQQGLWENCILLLTSDNGGWVIVA